MVSPGPSTEGMVDYDRHSSAQQTIVRSHEQRIRTIMDRLGRVEPEMRIVDYGCGPGTSAITSVRPAVEAYRASFPDAPVVVCHADQPGNDWNGLFALAFGAWGYRSAGDGVRTEAAVGSFYEQMVPAESVGLGMCFVASHWLSSAARLHAPGSVWFADLQGDARRAMAEQAQRDWTTFLTVRAQELRPDGRLLVSTLGSVPDPDELNGAAASGRGIYRAMQVVAQSMADDGLLDGEVLDGFVFGLWFMTAEEARSPLAEDERLATVYDVETVEVVPSPDHSTDIFGDLRSDPAAYADAYTGYIRAFADSSLRTQLFRPSARRGGSEADLADEFYDRLAALYRAQLHEFAFEVWQLTVVLRRIALRA